jgi:hypothetical protein
LDGALHGVGLLGHKKGFSNQHIRGSNGGHPKCLDRTQKLEAEGAELMVLGQLLIEGVHCFKAYTNFAGCDLALSKHRQPDARDDN